MSLHKNAQVVEVKKGDSLILGCRAIDAARAAVSLVGVTVAAQLRVMSTNELAANLQFSAVNLAQGEYELVYPGDSTIDLAVGDYVVDIEYSALDGGRLVRRSTRTFYVRVIDEVTQ